MLTTTTQIALLILVCIFSILSLIQTRNLPKTSSGNIVLILTTIILVIIAVTRPSTMADYANYKDIVANFEWGRYEPATYVINYISHLFHNPFSVFLLIYSIIGISTKVKILSELSPVFWCGLLIYLSNYYILMDLIQIRASIAGSMTLFMIKYSSERDKKNFFLSYIIASLFHYSALLSFFIWFISRDNLHRWFFFILLAISMLIGKVYMTSIQQIVLPLSTLFESITADDETTFVMQIKALCVCLAFWLYAPRLQKISPVSLIALKVYTIAICISWLFSGYSLIANRLADIYLISELILIPSSYYLFKNKKIASLICILYMIWTFRGTIITPDYWNP